MHHKLHNPLFRFREQEIERIHLCWQQGDSVLLTGIRRTGKSEVLKMALYRYQQQGNKIAFLDVQDRSNLADFYRELLQAILDCLPAPITQQIFDHLQKIPNDLMVWLRSHVRRIDGAGAGIELQDAPTELLLRYWQPLSDQIGEVLAEQADHPLPVIGIDELPFMLENLLQVGITQSELRILLASLRKLRSAGLRMIIAGSISFENLLSLQQIPHTVLGGLSRQSIPPFTRREAEQYLSEKFQDRPAVHAIPAILDTLPDYVPEFLKITVTHLHSYADQAECLCALTREVMPAIRRSFINQFDERLKKNYVADELQVVYAILDPLAQAEADGCNINSQHLPENYREVWLKLEYDNFIIEGNNFSWRFSLNLLRLWWRSNRGMS